MTPAQAAALTRTRWVMSRWNRPWCLHPRHCSHRRQSPPLSATAAAAAVALGARRRCRPGLPRWIQAAWCRGGGRWCATAPSKATPRRCVIDVCAWLLLHTVHAHALYPAPCICICNQASAAARLHLTYSIISSLLCCYSARVRRRAVRRGRNRRPDPVVRQHTGGQQGIHPWRRRLHCDSGPLQRRGGH